MNPEVLLTFQSEFKALWSSPPGGGHLVRPPGQSSPLSGRVGVQHAAPLHPAPDVHASQRLLLQTAAAPLDALLDPKHEHTSAVPPRVFLSWCLHAAARAGPAAAPRALFSGPARDWMTSRTSQTGTRASKVSSVSDWVKDAGTGSGLRAKRSVLVEIQSLIRRKRSTSTWITWHPCLALLSSSALFAPLPQPRDRSNRARADRTALCQRSSLSETQTRVLPPCGGEREI